MAPGATQERRGFLFPFSFLAFSFSYFFARCMMLAVCHGENFSWPLEGLSMFGSMHMIRREKREKDGYRNKPNHKWLHINNSKNQIIQGFYRQVNPEVSKSVYPEICMSALITSPEFWKFSSEWSLLDISGKHQRCSLFIIWTVFSRFHIFAIWNILMLK